MEGEGGRGVHSWLKHRPFCSALQSGYERGKMGPVTSGPGPATGEGVEEGAGGGRNTLATSSLVTVCSTSSTSAGSKVQIRCFSVGHC